MKNLIIIIGTIILAAIIVNTLVLGDGNSLKTAASDFGKSDLQRSGTGRRVK